MKIEREIDRGKIAEWLKRIFLPTAIYDTTCKRISTTSGKLRFLASLFVDQFLNHYLIKKYQYIWLKASQQGRSFKLLKSGFKFIGRLYYWAIILLVITRALKWSCSFFEIFQIFFNYWHNFFCWWNFYLNYFFSSSYQLVLAIHNIKIPYYIWKEHIIQDLP